MSATLKDVAREAHVSMASVSRALNGTGTVTESIRTRVLEAAARLQYVPNSGAQSLMTRRTHTIGIVLPTLYGEFFSELIRGIDIAARARGLHLLISSTHCDAVEAGTALQALIGRVDGLLVMSPYVDGRFLQERVRSSLPIVLISTVDIDHTHTSFYVDNYSSAYAMVAHLAGCGHRTIAHIAGPDVNVDAQERVRGYRAALNRELPGSAEYVLRGDFTEESGYRAGRELLATGMRPDAVFAANDMMAIGCLCALTEAGLRVPQDVAIAGFDDIPTARFVVPALTTVRVRISDMGGRALDRLATAIESPGAVPTRQRNSARRADHSRLLRHPGAACRESAQRARPARLVLLRPAEPADAMDVARVHVRAWQVAYRNLLPDGYLDGLKPEDRARRYTFGGTDPHEPMTTVAVDERGTIRGFVTTCAARDADVPGYGELAAIHVDPDWWGRGVGVALLASARVFLLDSGFRRAILWMLVGNVRAERFYAKDGWAPDGTQRTDTVWGVQVNDQRYRRSL